MAPRKSCRRSETNTDKVSSTSMNSEDENQYENVIAFLGMQSVRGDFRCDFCSKSYKKQVTFRAHRRRHVNVLNGRYRCDECGKCFPQNSTLVNHSRIHTQEKPFKCDWCGYAFADVSTLGKHVRLHTGEQPYTCQVCSKQFTQSGNMHRHIRSQHPVNISPLIRH